MSIRVLIADDHVVVRTGLVSLLAGKEFEVVAQAEDGKEATRLAKQHRPDVVLLDIRMADEDGFLALERIKRAQPELPVVVLSAFDNPTYVARAKSLGASAYLAKGVAGKQILDTVRAAAAGQSTWPRRELRRVSGALATPRVGSDADASLTQREADVLTRMADGLTNKEIAQQLDISYETVKEHVQHILHKIGVSDRTQAAIWAVRTGMV